MHIQNNNILFIFKIYKLSISEILFNNNLILYDRFKLIIVTTHHPAKIKKQGWKAYFPS